MAYEPRTWANGELVVADDMNRLEQGVADADATAATAAGAASENRGQIDALEAEKVGVDDPRLADARTPLAHAASHTASGDDPLTADDVGAAPAPVSATAALAAGASAGTVVVAVVGPVVVADLTGLVLTGTSEVVAVLGEAQRPSHRAGHGFVEDTSGGWWPVRATTTSIEVLGPAPAGTTVEGSLTWAI